MLNYLNANDKATFPIYCRNTLVDITKYYKWKFYLKLSTDLTEQGFLLTFKMGVICMTGY